MSAKEVQQPVWYVVYSKPREEQRAKENLENLGFQTLLPLARSIKRRASGRAEVVEPLFPRYLFVALERGQDDFSKIRSTRGCVGLVKFGLEPAKVPDALIDEVNSLLNEYDDQVVDLKLKAKTLKQGQRVTVADGHFSGLIGEVCALKPDERVIVLLDILGGKRKVEVKTTDLEG